MQIRNLFRAFTGIGGSQNFSNLVKSPILSGGVREQILRTMSTLPEVKGIQVSDIEGVRTIRLDRPAKKNCLSLKMYEGFRDILVHSNTDESTRVIVVTGTGDYFSAGNDLTNFMSAAQEDLDPQVQLKRCRNLIESFIASLIDCRKPLIALVNGHCIGIGTTMLGLCDAVYSSDRATFYAPFTTLGIVLECASSVTFPKIMGYAKAKDLLLFNGKWTAKEAELNGLVTEVIPDGVFQDQTWDKVKKIAALPINSMVYSKQLLRDVDREALHRANAAEWDRLEERFVSDECIEAVVNFMTSKSNL